MKRTMAFTLILSFSTCALFAKSPNENLAKYSIVKVDTIPTMDSIPKNDSLPGKDTVSVRDAIINSTFKSNSGWNNPLKGESMVATIPSNESFITGK